MNIISGPQGNNKMKETKFITPQNNKWKYAICRCTNTHTQTHTDTQQCGRFQITAAGDNNFVVVRV